MEKKFGALALALLLAATQLATAGWDWKDVTLARPAETTLGGFEGEMLKKGVARLALAPYDTEWVLADLSFAVKRIFTNFSGDVSGRYLELAALTSPAGQMSPENFPQILKRITDYQKADGHFGVEMDLTRPIAKGDPSIPIFWGQCPHAGRPGRRRPDLS